MRDNIIPFDQEVLDYESVTDEISILVPKYLEALEEIDQFRNFEDLPNKIQNVGVYWERLSGLFDEIASMEIGAEEQIKESCLYALQSELTVLEQVYLKINLRLDLDERSWTKTLWKAVEEVLDRMDTVLEGLGFDEYDDDRILITELQVKNREKYQKWLLSNRVLRR